MAFVTNKTFFKDISARANYVDIESIRKIYYALLKTILIELEKKEVMYLPHFGKFFIKEDQERNAPGLHGGPPQHWDKRKIIKFTPCDKLKVYIKNKT